MKRLLLLLFLYFSHFGYSQNVAKIDALQKQLTLAKSDTERVNLYIKIGNEYADNKYTQASKYFINARDLAQKINYTNGLCEYYGKMSKLIAYQGKLDSALAFDLNAYEWGKIQADKVVQARLAMNLGSDYLDKNELEISLKYYEFSKKIFEETGTTEYLGRLYDNLQSLERIRHNFRKGINYGLKAINILEHEKDTLRLIGAYNNIAIIYTELKVFDSALYYLNKSQKAHFKLGGGNYMDANYSLNFAHIHLLQNDFDKAKPFLDKALADGKEFGFQEKIGLATYGLAWYYLGKKEYNLAQNYAETSLATAEKINSRYIKLFILPILSQLQFAQQNPVEGFNYWQKYKMISDSFLNESVTRNMVQMEKLFETEKKESQIKLQQSLIKQKDILNWILLGCAALLIIVLFLLYRNYHNRQKIQQQRIAELETEKQLAATEAILKGEENERGRLAKDLHDGLGGMLSGIKFSLNNMKENLILTPQYADAFEHSLNMLDNSINEMRRVAHNLMPESLFKFGLEDALGDFCIELNRNGMLKVIYQAFGLKNVKLDQGLSITVYRIVQELLNNIIKHANAKQAIVQVTASSDLLSLTVEDDGIGFDQSKLDNVKGIGWNNIKSRVLYHKGNINIQTEAGKGTSVIIEFNLA